MSNTTGIEWTDGTWNPLTGCTKVSAGCDNCYAKTMHERFNGKGSFDTVTLHPLRLDQPLRWRKPSMVFVNSMSDLFHKDVPDEYIARVFKAMARAPQHTFQLLTKRHGRMRSLLSSPKWPELLTATLGWPRDLDPERPLDNLWLGVSS
jgi:protein gp37